MDIPATHNGFHEARERVEHEAQKRRRISFQTHYCGSTLYFAASAIAHLDAAQIRTDIRKQRYTEEEAHNLIEEALQRDVISRAGAEALKQELER